MSSNLNVSKDVNMENDDSNHSDNIDPEQTEENTAEAMEREKSKIKPIHIQTQPVELMNLSMNQEVQSTSQPVNCLFFFLYFLFHFFLYASMHSI